MLTSVETTDAAGAASHGVFQLYQEGLAPDQVLQLCYMRQRPHRRLRTERTRIEDAFVLPRPVLEIASVLPPVNISLQQLVGEASPATNTQPSSRADGLTPTNKTIAQATESVRKHFLLPREADPEELRTWSFLEETDWLNACKSLQSRQDQDDEMDGVVQVNTVALPDIADVCWMLEQCQSDDFFNFVWNHVLIPLLKRCVRSSKLKARSPVLSSELLPKPSISCSTPPYQTLFTLLVTHRSFASLNPKDFRAKVRSRKLRQVDDVFGAQAELLLISLYHQRR